MFRLSALLASVLGLAACAQLQPASSPGPGAVAELKPTQGSSVSGTVTFTRKGDRVQVVAKVSGLPRAGGHGFHVHEKGDCGAPDGMSAGGHFNPLGKPHGHHSASERHAGDLPMLVADAAGNAQASYEIDVIGVGSGAADVVGRAVIVHRDADDYKTQPTGNAGARLACGVVVRR